MDVPKCVDRDKAADLHRGAEDGDAHELLFEHDRAARRDEGYEDRRIEIGDVIAHVDTGASGGDEVEAEPGDADSGGADTGAGDPHGGPVEPGDVFGQERPGDADEAADEAESDPHGEEFDGCEEVLHPVTVWVSSAFGSRV